MATLNFCVQSPNGIWSKDTPIWTLQADEVPRRGSTVELEIHYDRVCDRDFPEREQELPKLAAKVFQVVDVHHKFVMKPESFSLSEATRSNCTRRTAKHQVFVVIKEVGD